MSKKLIWRYLIVVVLLAWAVYSLVPTLQYERLTSAEKIELQDEGKLIDLESKIIKRGLDLQGGMHLVLEVNVPAFVKNIAQHQSRAYYDYMDNVNAKFEANPEMDYLDIMLETADEDSLRLSRYFPSEERKTDNKSVIANLLTETEHAVIRAEEIIRNRVDQFGVSEPVIQLVGKKRIIVELAGIDDPQRAKDIIHSTALLEFVLLKDAEYTQDIINRIDAAVKRINPEDISQIDTAVVSNTTSTDTEISVSELLGIDEKDAGTADSSVLVDKNLAAEKPFSALLRNLGWDIGVPVENYYAVNKILNDPEVKRVLPNDLRILFSGRTKDVDTNDGGKVKFYTLFFVNREAGMTGEAVKEAKAELGSVSSEQMGQAIVNVRMNSEGTKTWARLTGANVDKRMAIVLDNKVQMAPRIKNKIPNGRTVVEGFANLDEAQDIEIVLKAGALPAPIDIIEERTVGASLGADSINRGVKSMLIGLMLVAIFIIVYYRGAGTIAISTLILNIFFVLAILASLRATLTLPGIAGLVLTMGMAVDANVLIFERIREEFFKGKTIRSAVDNGYSKAFVTILDANLTTLITALVLWQYGSGPIRGFAVTLFWGIIFNFVSGYFISRTIFTSFTHGKKPLNKLSI
ncbi:MAG: protein translocase subunit SecD [Candidatus Marinimicrobia bacterium]|nr:protein translocase subunit SecD [Candidatus Neomarinimicrobiota bacterium]